MKLLLGIGLLLLAAQLSESACFIHSHNTNATGESQEPIVCIDETDGSVHEVGESWNATNCVVCTCRNEGYGCCDRFITPLMYSEDCVAVLDLVDCVYRVHRKDDPSIECYSPGGVGK